MSMPTLDDVMNSAGTLETEPVSHDIIPAAAFASPVKKLDADNFMADDIDGVAETIFGSGNINYLALQAQQMDEARVLNDIGSMSQGSVFFSNSNMSSFVAQLATKLDNLAGLVDGKAAAVNNNDAGNMAYTDNSLDDATRSYQTGTTGRGSAEAASPMQTSSTDTNGDSSSHTETTTNNEGDVTNTTYTTSTTNITNITNNDDGDICCGGCCGGTGDVTINFGDIIVNIGDIVGDTGDIITNTLTIVSSIVDNTLTIVTGSVENILTTIINTVDDTVTNLLTTITDITNNTVTAVTSIVGDTLEFGTELVDVTNILETIIDLTQNIAGDTIDIVTNLLDNVVGIGDGDLILNLDLNLADAVVTDIDIPLLDPLGSTVDIDIDTTPVTDLVDDLTGGLLDALGLNAPNETGPDLSVDLGLGLLDNTDLLDTGVDVVLDPVEAIVGDIDIDVDANIDLLNNINTDGLGDIAENLGDTVHDFLGDVHDGGLLGATHNLVGDLLDNTDGQQGDDTDLSLGTDINIAGIEVPDINIDVPLDPLEALVGDIDLDVTAALDLLNGDNIDGDSGLGGLTDTLGDVTGGLLEGGGLADLGDGLWTEGGLGDSLTGGALDDILTGGDSLGEALGGVIPDPIGALDEGLGLLNTGGQTGGGGGHHGGGLFGGLFG
ncbi:MAG: hypothetical protein GC136_06710 [Alphaproteobacteria bacterium]|nr:hypothetical protein [Alphaproteobacteria bacterium]